MFRRAPEIRSLNWTCPLCGRVEVETLGWPEGCRRVAVVETIELTCEECNRQRYGVPLGKPVRHEAGKIGGGSTPPGTNRVFDKRSVAPEY